MTRAMLLLLLSGLAVMAASAWLALHLPAIDGYGDIAPLAETPPTSGDPVPEYSPQPLHRDLFSAYPSEPATAPAPSAAPTRTPRPRTTATRPPTAPTRAPAVLPRATRTPVPTIPPAPPPSPEVCRVEVLGLCIA